MKLAAAALVAGLLAGLLGASAQAPETATEAGTQSDAPPQFPPRTAVAGMPGLYTHSRITFFEAPDQPHELRVVLLFTGRARIELSATGADVRARQLEFRAGDRFFLVEGGSTKSVALTGQRRRELELRIELRRALLLWPDGATWSGPGTTRTTPLSDVGSLEVELDETGRPLTMRALDSEGTELESYAVTEWLERHGRVWPQSMEFSHRGARVWREELAELNIRPNFLDWFFLPADRRPQLPPSFEAAAEIRNVDLPPVVIRRVELDEDLTWGQALEHAAELVRATRVDLKPLGLNVEARVGLRLSDQGRATHAELRLTPTDHAPPPGWTAVGERPALALFREGLPADLLQTLERLRRSAPPGADTGHAYVLLLPGDGVRGRVQIVLPLLP